MRQHEHVLRRRLAGDVLTHLAKRRWRRERERQQCVEPRRQRRARGRGHVVERHHFCLRHDDAQPPDDTDRDPADDQEDQRDREGDGVDDREQVAGSRGQCDQPSSHARPVICRARGFCGSASSLGQSSSGTNVFLVTLHSVWRASQRDWIRGGRRLV